MSKKGENIFRRKDGRWEARYIHHYECGRAVYRYVYGASYTGAKRKKQAALSAPESCREPAAKQDMVFHELADLWLADIRISVKESTYTRYHRIIVKYLYPYLRDRRLARIDMESVQKLQDRLLEQGGVKGMPLAPKTVSDILCVLKAVFRYGQERRYPCPDISGLRYPQRNPRLVEIVADEGRLQMERQLLGADDTTSLGILFTLFTGVRIGELCGIRWEDIDFANAVVSIRRTVERIADLDPDAKTRTKVIVSEPKTGSSIRNIPLPAFLLQYLQNRQRDPQCYLLTGTRNHTEPHQYYMRYRRYMEKNGLGSYTFHALRHTFATRCVEEGFDSKSLAEILGHAGVSTTLSIYVHPTLQQKKLQMERLTPACAGENV